MTFVNFVLYEQICNVHLPPPMGAVFVYYISEFLNHPIYIHLYNTNYLYLVSQLCSLFQVQQIQFIISTEFMVIKEQMNTYSNSR